MADLAGERMNPTLLSLHKRGERPSYHLKMLKVILYAYCNQIYTSRRTESKFQVVFRNQEPGFQTSNHIHKKGKFSLLSTIK